MILFIQTGGTIDKDYPKLTKGWAFEIGPPAVHRILEKLNPSFDYEVVTAFQKDSMEITEDDRIALLKIISKSSISKVIITHGTDTMIDTALFLSKNINDKTIVLTGAMRPEQFSNSDAPINLGAAIATANLLEKGVFVTMNGLVKPANKMDRNLDTGKFF